MWEARPNSHLEERNQGSHFLGSLCGRQRIQPVLGQGLPRREIFWENYVKDKAEKEGERLRGGKEDGKMKGGRQKGGKEEEKERKREGTPISSLWAAWSSFPYLVKVWPLMGDKFLLRA